VIERGYFLRTLATAVAMIVVCYALMVAICVLVALIF